VRQAYYKFVTVVLALPTLQLMKAEGGQRPAATSSRGRSTPHLIATTVQPSEKVAGAEGRLRGWSLLQLALQHRSGALRENKGVDTWSSVKAGQSWSEGDATSSSSCHCTSSHSPAAHASRRCWAPEASRGSACQPLGTQSSAPTAAAAPRCLLLSHPQRMHW